MNTAWARNCCRLLIALMIWAPYQVASAGMIATDESVASSAAQDRAEVVSALRALGVDAAAAKDRVAAMTDQEARVLAGEIASVPAGGVYAAGLVAIILISLIAWAWYKHRNPY